MSDFNKKMLLFFNLWGTLFLIWLIANNSLGLQVVLSGVVISMVIAFSFTRFSHVYTVIRWSPKRVFYYFIYLGVFIIELVKANFNVMRFVFSPRINIKPGIVEIKTHLKSPLGRLALANSITLTPGTLVVDIKGDSIFVHWIDVSAVDAIAATQFISARFEKYLKVIYG